MLMAFEQQPCERKRPSCPSKMTWACNLLIILSSIAAVQLPTPSHLDPAHVVVCWSASQKAVQLFVKHMLKLAKQHVCALCKYRSRPQPLAGCTASGAPNTMPSSSMYCMVVAVQHLPPSRCHPPHKNIRVRCVYVVSNSLTAVNGPDGDGFSNEPQG
jgi:hypothetical protein